MQCNCFSHNNLSHGTLWLQFVILREFSEYIPALSDWQLCKKRQLAQLSIKQMSGKSFGISPNAIQFSLEFNSVVCRRGFPKVNNCVILYFAQKTET